jgi:hypothetical protein
LEFPGRAGKAGDYHTQANRPGEPFLANQMILTYHVKIHGTIAIGSEINAVKLVLPEEIIPWPYGTGPAL